MKNKNILDYLYYCKNKNIEKNIFKVFYFLPTSSESSIHSLDLMK